MKAIILAGGLGTRLGSMTEKIPKPMVKINNKPIIWHIMSIYSKFGINDFIVALGYRGDIIKDYFKNYKEYSSNLKINLDSNKIEYIDYNPKNWNITLIDTGNDTMTGGRLKRLEKYIDDKDFLLTYGDGLSNVDIGELIKFHKSNSKIATVTAVRPKARFGELIIENKIVKSFKEKPNLDRGWINGGFFVFNRKIFQYIDNDSIDLEGEPLEIIAKNNELMAYKHHGFWECMDTPRDKENLERLSKSENVYPWIK